MYFSNKISKLADETTGTPCEYPYCGAKSKTRGMCDYHYKQWLNVEHWRSKIAAPNRSTPAQDDHAIYIIGCQEIPYFKVGRTAKRLERKAGIQTGCPFQVYYFGLFFAPRPEIVFLEHEVHKALTSLDCHHRGEWFCIEPTDAAAVILKVAQREGIVLRAPIDQIDRVKGVLLFGQENLGPVDSYIAEMREISAEVQASIAMATQLSA